MNYEFKGTPGPWVVSYQTVDMESKNPFDGEFTDTHCAATISHKESNFALASTLGIDAGFGSSSWVPGSKAIPNAHLIASSPDLFHSLKEIIIDLKILKNNLYAAEPHEIQKLIDRGEVALQKALNINQ